MYRNVMPSTRTCACRTAPWHSFLRGLAQVHRLDAAATSPLRTLPSRNYSSMSKKSLRSLHSSIVESAEQEATTEDAAPKPAKKRWRNMSVDELTEWHSALRWKKKAMKHERIQEEKKEEEFLGRFEDVIVDKNGSDGNVNKTKQRERPVFVQKQQMDLEQVKLERKIARVEAKKSQRPAKKDDAEGARAKDVKKGSKKESRPKRAPKTDEEKAAARAAREAKKAKAVETRKSKTMKPNATPAIELETQQASSPIKPGRGRNARRKLRFREQSLNAMNICVLPQRHAENPIARGWLPSMTLQILEPREAEPEASDKLNPAEMRKAEEWEAIDRAAGFNFVLPSLYGQPDRSELPALTLRVLGGGKHKATDAALGKIKAKTPREVAEKKKGGRKVSAARTKGSAAVAAAAAATAVTARKVVAPSDVDIEAGSAEEQRSAGRKSRKEMADIARRKQMEKPLPGVKDYLKRQESRALRKEQEAKEKQLDPETYAAKKAARNKKPQWALQREALKKKFPTGWQPRKKLSPDALIGIRALNAEYPDVYTTQALSEKFEMDPEAIRRILKSKWEPSAEEEERRQKAWHERGLAIWERKAALGIKPPRKWRREGVGREPGWKEYRAKVARREREWEEGEREAYRVQRESLSTRLAGKVL